jgi:arylsulfatase A-like enzyme
VVIIVVDCLRADHLFLYGYRRKTSPGIDAFAKDAIVFRQAISQAPTTLLSFASVFTSMDISAHGLTGSARKLGDSPLALAEIFKIYGYRTAAFTCGLNLNPMYGFNKGFDLYSHTDRTASFPIPFIGCSPGLRRGGPKLKNPCCLSMATNCTPRTPPHNWAFTTRGSATPTRPF